MYRTSILSVKIFCVVFSATERNPLMPPMPTVRSLWDYLYAFPPPYCRLFAKEAGSGPGNMALTDVELAVRANLPLSRVREISHLERWDSVPIEEMRAFFSACNFDPTNSLHRQRVSKYEKICQQRKTVPFHYLRRSPKWGTEFLPLLLLVDRIMKSRSGSSPVISVAGSPTRS